jgi:hypothetical protein
LLRLRSNLIKRVRIFGFFGVTSAKGFYKPENRKGIVSVVLFLDSLNEQDHEFAGKKIPNLSFSP